MAGACSLCGSDLIVEDCCASCGARQSRPSFTADPYVGRKIADRYEVGELISVGGMGRVHRGVQLSLDRPVAIKFIHPHLLTSQGAVARFMLEARAASRLNHPHVVSIHDFGQIQEPGGGDLYIVMELLGGSDLSSLLRREPLLPLPRTLEIVRQILEALGEAHRRGVVHRDVKPENVIVESRESGREHVKIIDFGVASLGEQQRITQDGQTVGTPLYMAPEQIRGNPATASFDLYAVAVILFEMITGRLPFDAPSPHAIMAAHLSAIRPDPRAMAPQRNIPLPLAEVCMRAMHPDPAQRYPTASELSQAILQAGRGTGSTGVARTIDRRMEMASTMPGLGSGGADDAPLLGRAEDLSWIEARFRDRAGITGVLLWGRPGIGRTRLGREAARVAASNGAVVLSPALPPPPLNEVGFSSLRVIVAALAGVEPTRAALVTGRIASDPRIARWLHALFGDGVALEGTPPEATRKAAAEVFKWAVRAALDRAGGRDVVLFIDDVHHADSSTRVALADGLRDVMPPRFFLLLTSARAQAVGRAERLVSREIGGISREQSRLLLGPRSERPLLARREDFEPLYLELLGRLRAMSPAAADPPSLVEVIETHLQTMPGHVRLVLAAVAAAGIVGLGDLACLDLPAGAPARAFNTLARERYIDIEGGQARLIHPLFGEVAVGSVPASAVAEVHAHMESGLANRTDCEELRAYHALRGHPDLAAYLLMEGVARQRDARGDYGGAIVALRDAVVVAQSQYTRGDPDALSVWASFGRKLASALTRVGRTDDAHGVLTEILHVLDPRDPARPLLLEQLTDVAERRGRAPDAARYRAEAGALRSARSAPR